MYIYIKIILLILYYIMFFVSIVTSYKPTTQLSAENGLKIELLAFDSRYKLIFTSRSFPI